VRSNFGSAQMCRRPLPVIAEEEAGPATAGEDTEEEDKDADDAADVPEIDADVDADIDPVIVRD